MILPWDVEDDPRGKLVSIVTPTYDRADLLPDAVKCVVDQTYRPIEHIVVGDGCPTLEGITDKILEINPELHIVNLPRDPTTQNYGPARIARVRNAGVRLARGSFIGHLDDDNRFTPRHIEALIETFCRRPDAAVAYSYRTLLIEGRKPFTTPCFPWSSTIEDGRLVWEIFRRMGLFEAGSPVMRDRLSFHEERECTLDTDELLVRREAHSLFPFVERYPEALVMEEMGEDDVFCEQLYRFGFRFVCSAESTLEFRLGGRFTSMILDQLDNHGRE